MKRVRLAINWLLPLALLIPIPLHAAGPALEGSGAIIAPQSAGGGDGQVVGRQPQSGSSTLEIAPQPPTIPQPADKVAEGAQRSFKPADDVANLDPNRNSKPPDDGRLPYIGAGLEYTTQCFLGMEEHGFEVVTIDPDSPAARAGLVARKPSTPLGDLETLGSVIAFPLALVTVPRLRRSGALGMPGDLIVAVDDYRVRTERELMAALYTLRAGDVVYFTVIRPVVGGGHRTMRIVLHIDSMLDPPRSSRAR